MLEPPDIQDTQIAACLEKEYGLSVTEITFLPLGADVDTAVFHITTENAPDFFLKLRRGSIPNGTVTVPFLLAERGMQQIIAPLKTNSTGELSTQLGAFTAILYPFVDGRSGWEVDLSKQQWVDIGRGLRGLHTRKLSSALSSKIPEERYSSIWRDRARAYLKESSDIITDDPIAKKLIGELKDKLPTIQYIVSRAEQLAGLLVGEPIPFCVCHGDIHAGNVLIDTTGQLYIVDWDTLILAPKERDLMFIGGGIGGRWNDDREVKWFYQGYGRPEINHHVLAYYRYERIVQDIAEICELILEPGERDEDRAVMLDLFINQFKPGNVVEAAYRTDQTVHSSF